jgi:septal ring factor EnvC (AmiA/AmiB activator)
MIALRVILDIAPYFAIAALSLGILIAWILRASAPAGADPLAKVSPGFLVGLVATLFVAFLLVSASSIIENSRIRQTIAMQQGLLTKAAAQKKSLEKNAAAQKREIGELRAQKALYTVTLETLSKK